MSLRRRSNSDHLQAVKQIELDNRIYGLKTPPHDEFLYTQFILLWIEHMLGLGFKAYSHRKALKDKVCPRCGLKISSEHELCPHCDGLDEQQLQALHVKRQQMDSDNKKIGLWFFYMAVFIIVVLVFIMRFI